MRSLPAAPPSPPIAAALIEPPSSSMLRTMLCLLLAIMPMMACAQSDTTVTTAAAAALPSVAAAVAPLSLAAVAVPTVTPATVAVAAAATNVVAHTSGGGSGGGNGNSGLRSRSGAAHTPSRFAYVLMHYEGTPKDDEYLLGMRVLIRSIQETGTPHDIVVITSTNVRDSTKQTLLDDGALLNEVANLQNPFETKVSGRNSYKARFIYSLNKLYAWNMTMYERVLFLDSDNIFLTNMDSVFMCGHFCVVYMNPLIFHTGLLVIKPDTNMFNKLINALYSDASFSHDGADQGFLVAQFDVEHAPLFLPADYADGKPSEEPAMRLNIGWNINHFWYYIAFDWEWFFHSPGTSDQYPWIRAYNAAGQSAQTVAGSSLAYCSGMMLKPWYWFPTFYFLHHYEWHAKRDLLGIDYSATLLTRLAGLVPLWLLYHYLTKRSRIDRLTALEPVRDLVLRAFSLAPVLFGYLYGVCAFVLHSVAVFQLIPYVTPPRLAWTIWVVWHLSLMYVHLGLLVNVFLRPTPAAMKRGAMMGLDAKHAVADKDEIAAAATASSGWHAALLLIAAQCVFLLCWLNIYPHFIIKIAFMEYFLLIWIGLQAHVYRRATERMCGLLPSARS